MFTRSVVPLPISGPEAPSQLPTPPSSRCQLMAASSPAKSQPPPNLPLADLKWTMDHSNSPRLRKHSCQSPMREAVNLVADGRNGVSSSSSDSELTVTASGSVKRSEEKPTPADRKSKIKIRFRPKRVDIVNAALVNDVATAAAPATALANDVAAALANDVAAASSVAPSNALVSNVAAAVSVASGVAIDEDVSGGDRISAGGQKAEPLASKPWNLRPKKPKKRPFEIDVGPRKRSVSSAREEKAPVKPESSRSRNNAVGATERKEKRQKLSIPLSRMEIFDDILAMTGARPSRKPQKRSKNVQEQLDVLFPCVGMSTVSLNDYKVPKAF